jgi:hypothetical protein
MFCSGNSKQCEVCLPEVCTAQFGASALCISSYINFADSLLLIYVFSVS